MPQHGGGCGYFGSACNIRHMCPDLVAGGSGQSPGRGLLVLVLEADGLAQVLQGLLELRVVPGP